MKPFFKKGLLFALICVLIVGSFALFACREDGNNPPSPPPPEPPEQDEIAYYKIPDSFWLKLSFSDGTERNYVKFKGTHNGKACDIYYSDSGKNYKTEECVVQTDENTYYKYAREYEAGLKSDWARSGGKLDKKAAGKAVFTMFNILFTGNTEGGFVLDTLDVEGAEVVCKKYSQTGSFGTSYYWRPDGFDFWIQCRSFSSTGNPITIYALKLDLQLQVLPQIIDLPA